MFIDKIAGLNPKQSISTNIKLNILEDLKDDISFTAVASKRHVSIQTVIDIFESFVSIDRIPFGYVLCMDEFKNLKSSSGKYEFVMYGPNSHMINDVLPDRIQKTIDDYLYHLIQIIFLSKFRLNIPLLLNQKQQIHFYCGDYPQNVLFVHV